MSVLDAAGLAVEISAVPSDIPDGIPFTEDALHANYEPEWANRFWRALVSIDRVLKAHRGRFRGKVSPVQLCWGSFDLAYRRYSGRPADREHAACGFWPGDRRFPYPAFYAYTAPRPQGIEGATLQPDAAFWSTDLGEFLLPYDAVRTSSNPDDTLLGFLDSAYRVGADLSGWGTALIAGGRRSGSLLAQPGDRVLARGEHTAARLRTAEMTDDIAHTRARLRVQRDDRNRPRRRVPFALDDIGGDLLELAI